MNMMILKPERNWIYLIMLINNSMVKFIGVSWSLSQLQLTERPKNANRNDLVKK
jgi:hypothetical protein